MSPLSKSLPCYACVAAVLNTRLDFGVWRSADVEVHVMEDKSSTEEEEEQTDSDDERHRQRVNNMSYESSMVH